MLKPSIKKSDFPDDTNKFIDYLVGEFSVNSIISFSVFPTSSLFWHDVFIFSLLKKSHSPKHNIYLYSSLLISYDFSDSPASLLFPVSPILSPTDTTYRPIGCFYRPYKKHIAHILLAKLGVNPFFYRNALYFLLQDQESVVRPAYSNTDLWNWTSYQ